MSDAICSTCHDTHRMHDGHEMVMCTHCPTPCRSCACGGGGRGAYCATTPCPCSCHLRTRDTEPPPPPESDLVAKEDALARKHACRSTFDAISAVARREAKRLADDAGYGGRMDDGGSRALLAIVDAWECGLAGRVPARLEQFRKTVARESDPEWAEYQRLQRRFGGGS